MTFSEQLNEYLSILNCSAKELSQISGLSNSVISRYRSGERVPRPESEKFNQLCEGIYLQNVLEYAESLALVFAVMLLIFTFIAHHYLIHFRSPPSPYYYFSVHLCKSHNVFFIQ